MAAHARPEPAAGTTLLERLAADPARSAPILQALFPLAGTVEKIVAKGILYPGDRDKLKRHLDAFWEVLHHARADDLDADISEIAAACGVWVDADRLAPS